MSRLALLDHRDVGWIADVVDVVETSAGRPWRDALDRLDDLQRAQHGDTPRRFSAVVAAVQRLTGGRARNAAAARDARRRVLGAPALSGGERQARIVTAAGALGVPPAALEKLLWSDLPRERPVELPGGRPVELDVAAFANVAILQRAFRRAHAITLRTSGDPGPLLRACARRGLLVTATIEGATTEIVIVGPLALFHRTSVYGRALAQLVPLLGELGAFQLAVHAETPTAIYAREVDATRDAPVLLPAPPARLSAVPYPIAKLARELQRQASRDQPLVVTCLPAPIVAGRTIVCPELLVEHGARRCAIDIVTFGTAELVERRLAAYRGIGLDAIVCLAAEASVEQIVARLQHRWGTLCG